MSVKQKREQVLEKIYDELLDGDLDELLTQEASSATDRKGGQHPMVQLIATLENAKSAEEDVELKGDVLEFDNAHFEIGRRQDKRIEMAKLIATVATNVVWGVIFVHELKATRLFEIDGTEVSAAGRWLKQSFPKLRML